MSTTGNNAPDSTAPASLPGGELAHSDLVAKLLAEAFAGQPGAPRPGIPAVTGLPAGETPSPLPPVHPGPQSGASQPVAPAPAGPAPTPSGAHSPDPGDSYAFGEPRCNGSYRPQGNRPDTKATNTSPVLAIPEAEPAPEYYFLDGGGVAGKSPAACQSYPANSVPVPKFDLEGVRRDFPALHQLVNGKPLIWLDNAATTHKPQAVIDATSQFYARDNSNIHRAAHTLAARSTELFEAGREKVRKFLGAADAREIVFVRGTTEGINLVAQTYGRKNIGPGDEIIVSELEHHANIVPWQLLAEQVGASVKVIPINDRGELILDEYVKLLGPRTKFVSVAHVSNSLGTINPVEQIIALAHARGVPVLVDGAQSTPHLPVNVAALDADFYVFSGHKIFAPTGIGALYGKSALLETMPPWQGGGHMIRDVRFEKTVYQNAPEKFEAGTPDIAGVVGLGAAIDYLFKIGIPAIAAYEHALLEYAAPALAAIPGLRPIGTAANKASVLAFVIPSVPNESIARHLDKHGIAVRAGHHCAQPAIRHFGLESSVRPSLAFYNTRDEVDTLVRALRSLKRN
jgi:cysteine desulfurase / selenocysteine lyase